MRRVNVIILLLAAWATLEVAHIANAGELHFHRGWTAYVRDGWMFGYPGARYWGGTHCWYPPHVAPWPANNGYMSTIPYPGMEGMGMGGMGGMGFGDGMGFGNGAGSSVGAGGYESVPDKTGIAPNSLLLNVRVPNEAVVFINGQRTNMTGTERRYTTTNVEPGLQYTYEIRAEIPVAGEIVTKTETIYASPGKMTTVNLRPNSKDKDVAKSASPARSTLALNVPATSRVYVNGQLMRSTGTTRVFTTSLPEGSNKLAEYDVRVEVEQNGAVQVREETVWLAAGSTRNLTIDFDPTQVSMSPARD